MEGPLPEISSAEAAAYLEKLDPHGTRREDSLEWAKQRIRAMRSFVTSEEIIAAHHAGDLTETDGLAQLLAYPFTFGRSTHRRRRILLWTWDQVGAAAGRGLLPDAQYERIALTVASRRPALDADHDSGLEAAIHLSGLHGLGRVERVQGLKDAGS